MPNCCEWVSEICSFTLYNFHVFLSRDLCTHNHCYDSCENTFFFQRPFLSMCDNPLTPSQPNSEESTPKKKKKEMKEIYCVMFIFLTRLRMSIKVNEMMQPFLFGGFSARSIVLLSPVWKKGLLRPLRSIMMNSLFQCPTKFFPSIVFFSVSQPKSQWFDICSSWILQ